MKLTGRIIALVISFFAGAASAETQDLNAFQRVFKVGRDAKNVRVWQLLPKKKIATQLETTPIDNCYSNGDDGITDCKTYKYTYEKGLELLVVGSDNTLTTHFRLSEFSDEVVAGLPKVNFFGKGSKKNREYAQAIVDVKLEDRNEVEWHIDEENTVWCPTDGEGSKLDPSCQDQIVTKPVPVVNRYAVISVK